MFRWLCCLMLAGVLGGQALAAPSAQRLASIKQHALALHTVSLSDPRRFASNTVVLFEARHAGLRPQRLRLWLDDSLWYDANFDRLQSERLQAGATQFLGLAPLPAGGHRLRVEIEVRDVARDDAPAYSLSQQQALTLPDWPRGLRISLSSRRGGQADIELSPAIDGQDLMRAAEHSLATGLPGRAISILQTLSQVDAGATQDARHTLLLGRSLAAWGLDSAAEATFAQLIGGRTDATLQATARLRAAELALSLQRLTAARRYLDWPDGSWPATQRGPARVLLNRLLLAEGAVEEAGRQLPEQAPLTWQYNLGLALLAAGQGEPGETLLARIGTSPATDPQSQAVRGLANLKLGYWLLEQRRPEAARDALGRVTPASAAHSRALLGRGWAELSTLADSDGGSIRRDDLRPAHIQRLDAAVPEAPERKRKAALLRALESWTLLRDGDPMDPAVQEALVAIPYALALLDADARAISYAELAIARLDAARLGLSRIYTRSIGGDTLDAAALAATAWPPQAGAWSERISQTQWWRQEQPQAPLNAHMAQLLPEAQTLRILHHLSVLSEAEAMIRAAAQAPDLESRATLLLQRIEAERAVQQKELNRFIWTWLDRRGTMTTRYLVMARLILGQVAGRQP